MSQQSAPAIPLPFQISRMVTSYWVPQALHVAAELGVADVLADGPKQSADVARAVGANPGALHRLLRALTVLEVCTQTDDGAFALTPLGACLRSDTPDSVRAWVMMVAGERVWASWGRLVDCVRTGDSVPKQNGVGAFDGIVADGEAGAVFNQSMAQLTRHLAPAVAAAYDFSGFRTIVDVGGGYGALLPPILKANPELRGAVFDLPHCRDGALALFRKTGIADRCEFVAGSFFEDTPPPADAYLVKSVIHDWDDERSIALLRTVRKSAHERSRLLVVEPIVPERMGSTPFHAMLASSDLNMMVVTGGRERTETEFRQVIEGAGFHVTRVVPTQATMSVIEATPA
ncbi:MAG TPA: methyltransferase [Candidatus Eisenbacteria bacterium]|nr:methyltransferase [Candidatus Eisenbacteria bacterium]